MEFSRIFMLSCFVMLLCSSLAYGQATTMSPTPTPTPTPAPAPGPAFVNLTYLLSVAGPYHTFLNYLESTKLIDTFQNQANDTDQGITIFVPKDDAFKALNKKQSLSKLSDEQLKSVILFHALPRYYALADFNDLSTKGPITTLGGGQFTLNFADDSGTVRLDSGWSKTKVTSAVQSTDPVAIYQVDKVLLPEAVFGTDIPPSPAPAPANDISPSADTPLAVESKENGSSSSSSSSHRIMDLDIWSQVVFGFLGGWMVMFSNLL